MDDLIYDPLGLDIFVIAEMFESVFNGLSGVYFRLYYKESKRSEDVRNFDREKEFYKRFREMVRLKRSYEPTDWIKKREAVDLYCIELRKMIALELTEYRDFKINGQ
ncbi:hypothetical protein [Mucilaginibacter lappiensis]|uniref:Uncharacterized protein n=1 Tax=Mucilaginibacter lappiensis TaxID=354630 RepID=A0A1N6P8W8_9SPHI|nr:hypothetical protein [Mucilaginibacter lappiensis]MBB6107675.1 hypothetical protein [Mucilaginibacter lappiensis]MBB6131476.1 hypothetical protein [Mucilaginibacter lappiensis]SIQ00811.1 hypothetical protein SAMN05421821_101408 [Mucilaginibacter lappiensis]